MNKTSVKISIFLNIVIVLLTIFSFVMMFTGFKIMTGDELLIESSKIGLFKFFTVDSNLLMGLTSLVFLIEEISVLKNNKNEIKTSLYVLKLASTTAVTLTFLVVFFYLGPVTHSLKLMLMNSNLFFHLIIPVLSIITFVFFERTIKIRFKHTLYGVLPTFIYGLYYFINVLNHMENGKVTPQYDFYLFVQNGVYASLIVIPLMLVFTYLICLVLWFINKKR